MYQGHSASRIQPRTQTTVLQVDGMAVHVVQTTGQMAAAAAAGMEVYQVGLRVQVVHLMPILQLLGFLEVTHQRQHTR